MAGLVDTLRSLGHPAGDDFEDRLIFEGLVLLLLVPGVLLMNLRTGGPSTAALVALAAGVGAGAVGRTARLTTGLGRRYRRWQRRWGWLPALVAAAGSAAALFVVPGFAAAVTSPAVVHFGTGGTVGSLAAGVRFYRRRGVPAT